MTELPDLKNGATKPTEATEKTSGLAETALGFAAAREARAPRRTGQQL